MKYLEKLLKGYYAKNGAKTKLENELKFTTKAKNISKTNEQAKALLQEISTLRRCHTDIEPILQSYLSQSDGTYKAYKESIITIEKLPEEFKTLSQAFDDQEDTISKIKAFTDTVISNEKEIYQKMNIEEHRLTVDFKHKLSLTFLRALQIFIFVFSTYWAATLAVKSITYFNFSPPKMPFSIVPNIVTKTTKTIEGVTNPGITPDQS
jgi:hypothetical protein